MFRSVSMECDHRLVEYVFNAPWPMKTFDGREKSLLRGATRDLLPQSIVERRKAPYPSTQAPGYDRAIKQELGKVVAEPGPPALPLLDLNAIQQHLDAPVEKRRPCWKGASTTRPRSGSTPGWITTTSKWRACEGSMEVL
ncbi:asparagine synthetase B (glutamine-hydrolyzing) [Kibdelosporangium banguiense]|uniref:asparagine synthase (glutamine-hydrolyzing) n=1 Tax=Kibdelosporangium banguiense TaxID=1365924 RepID=A0ABS4TS45_9PSEU|nr:asparagine synthase-related protein [Kibdelosporangium banguiense]MBP2326738.1 asparagine synthetase B (glutamine-hydrolyzing) [Kibdelosporangium banguiense]